MIHVDTSFLIRTWAGASLESARYQGWLRQGKAVQISAVAWTEFLCGPARIAAITDAAALLGEPQPLTGVDAVVAARLFNLTGRRRGSLADCCIAAIAMNAGAALATNDVADFRRFEPYGLLPAS